MSEAVNEQNLESLSSPPIQITGITIYIPNQIQISGQLSYGYASRVSMASITPSNYQHEVRVWSELEKHKQELQKLKEKGLITEEEILEILSQHALFFERVDELLERHNGKVAVMCGGDLFIGDTLNEAVAKARAKHGNRPYYSETINLIDIPSLFPSDADRVSR